uniref:MATH domain-containing protein n=1 Tax=Elaeophora elaphi TaxID=1147741 RepID=A0A0R3S1X6_9BILA
MDDFIFPEDIEEENIGATDLDADGGEVTISGDGRELKQRSETVLSVDYCAQAMSNTLQKYGEVKKRIAEVDGLAMQASTLRCKVDELKIDLLNYLFQLSFGMRLQAEMDKCASKKRNFPLHIALKRQKLSSGASLLMIQLRNSSPFEMIKWNLVLTTSSYQTSTTAERKDKIFTKVIPIERLSQHSEFIYEVFCTRSLPLSLFFRVHLLKCIYLFGNREPRAFRIALEPIYLTHWNTVTIMDVPKNTISGLVYYARVDEEQKITLPDALVYLICDGKQTETMLLNWIIINTVTDRCDCINCMVMDDDNVRWPFAIEIKKRGLNYDVVLKMKNAKMRCTLIDELKIRILVTYKESLQIRMRYIWKELKEKEDCELLLNNKSLSDCFASLIAKYKR